ncbi:hypothetical protein [Natrinema salaciae]|nr:hypothetical protein [Natrinema salaciae]
MVPREGRRERRRHRRRSVEIGTRVAVEFRDVDGAEIAVPVFVPEGD